LLSGTGTTASAKINFIYKEVSMMKNSICLLLALLLTACANNINTPNGASQWDFDHQVQFKQTDLKNGKYHLQVITKQSTEFSKLATFLMRQSLRLCKSYGFKIEVLEGVERFDDKLSFPNMIMPSLSANIECPT
jgi:hypothetical protein